MIFIFIILLSNLFILINFYNFEINQYFLMIIIKNLSRFNINKIISKLFEDLLNEKNLIFIFMINKDILIQEYIFLLYDLRLSYFHFLLMLISMISWDKFSYWLYIIKYIEFSFSILLYISIMIFWLIIIIDFCYKLNNFFILSHLNIIEISSLIIIIII